MKKITLYSSMFGKELDLFVCDNCDAKYEKNHTVCPFCGYDETNPDIRPGHYGHPFDERRWRRNEK